MGKKVNIKLTVEELLDMLEKAGGHVTSRSLCYDGVELEITMCPDKYDSELEFEVEAVPTKVPEYVVRIGKCVLEGSFFTDFDESYFDWADNRPNFYGDDRIESARKFTDKEQAEAVATLINGEVEEYYG